jgi:hypothetical protein
LLWLDKDALQHWHTQEQTGKRGKPRFYSDQAIVCALRLREVYRLPLRATEGLLRSLITLLKADITVPSYSTLCRRQAGLAVELSAVSLALEPKEIGPKEIGPKETEPLHLVVDGKGLKVFGDGEWKARQHGVSKRRTWRKVHLAVDEKTGLVKAAATTTNSISDGQMLPELLEQVTQSIAQVTQSIAQVSADGGYDHRSCYEVIAKRHARAVIPPRRSAKIWQHGNCKAEPLARDENLRRIRQVGRAKWKRESGLPSAQSGGNRDVSAQDDLRGRTSRPYRGGSGHRNQTAPQCAQPNDSAGNARRLLARNLDMIYATKPFLTLP